MVKINGFRNNYIARRAELFGIISSNPNWIRDYMVKQDPPSTLVNPTPANQKSCYCNLGFVLHQMGYTDQQIMQMRFDDTVMETIANRFDLHTSTIDNIHVINDNSINFQVNVDACRVYLLNKNGKRAWDIVADASPYIGAASLHRWYPLSDKYRKQFGYFA